MGMMMWRRKEEVEEEGKEEDENEEEVNSMDLLRGPCASSCTITPSVTCLSDDTGEKTSSLFLFPAGPP